MEIQGKQVFELKGDGTQVKKLSMPNNMHNRRCKQAPEIAETVAHDPDRAAAHTHVAIDRFRRRDTV